MAKPRAITVTLRRPFLPCAGCSKAPEDILSGTSVTIPFYPGTSEIAPGAFVSHLGILRHAAKVPCEDLDTDLCDCGDGYGCSHGGWFWCKRFENMEMEKITTCLGDKCRCPSSRVRAAAREALQGKEASPCTPSPKTE